MNSSGEAEATLSGREPVCVCAAKTRRERDGGEDCVKEGGWPRLCVPPCAVYNIVVVLN